MLNTNLTELEQLFSAGQIACPHCHSIFSKESLAALSTLPCPSCGNPIFVGIKVGEYHLQEPVSDDGSQGVFLAVAQEGNEMIPVVVKLIAVASQTHPSQIKALWNEAQVGGLLNDTDYVSGCLDHGVSNGYYYIVRPYVEGERLDQHITRHGRLSPIDAIKLGMHLLAAIQHIYRVGFLFRNLKPENILLNSYGYAVLFGLGQCRPVNAAQKPETPPQPTAPVSFFAPERLLNQGETIASELYSLGMVMYYALTGHAYFSNEEFNELLSRRFAGTRPVEGRFADFPASLAILLDTLLRFNSAERPHDCAEVTDSLKAILTELEED